MFIIEDDRFFINRGDYGNFTATVKFDGEPYTLGAGDIMEMTVREVASEDSPVLIHLTSTDGYFVIMPEDTAHLAVGKYSADIQLKLQNGRPFTAYPEREVSEKAKNWKNFIIGAEVTIP